jgi:imidazolonepropionase-like amidohydrolase
MTVEEMRAATDIAHRQGVKVAAHTGSISATLDALEAGVDSFEHGYFLNDDVFRKMKDKDAWYVPTIVVSQAGAMEFFRKIGSTPFYLARVQMVGKSHWAALQSAIRIGANIAMGSDQFPYEPNEGTVASVREIELYNEAGMTPLQALRTATVNAARMLGAEQDLGLVASGKYADLIALDADPVSNIRALRTISVVIKGGEVVRNDADPSAVTTPL